MELDWGSMLTTNDNKVLKEIFVTKEEFKIELTSSIDKLREELIERMDKNTDMLVGEIKALIIKDNENGIQNLEQRNN